LEFLNLKDFEKADFLYKSIDFIEQKKNFEKQQKKIEKEQILIKNLENNYRKRIHIFSKLNVYIKNKRKK
jgi:hypothetical protein